MSMEVVPQFGARPVGHIQLGKNMADMRLDRPLGDNQASGDGLVGAILRQEFQDLPFLGCQMGRLGFAVHAVARIALAFKIGAQDTQNLRVKQHAAGRYNPHGFDNLRVRRRLEDIASYTCPQRPQDTRLIHIRRESQNTGCGSSGPNLSGGLYPTDLRAAEDKVHENHFWLKALDGAQYVLAARAQTNDVNVVGRGKIRLQAIGDHRMVFNDQNCDAGRGSSRGRPSRVPDGLARHGLLLVDGGGQSAPKHEIQYLLGHQSQWSR